MTPDELIAERGKTHGDWNTQSRMSQGLKNVLRSEPALWFALPAMRREALELMAVKMSRIVCGDDDHPDHWDDISGYSGLGKGNAPFPVGYCGTVSAVDRKLEK